MYLQICPDAQENNIFGRSKGGGGSDLRTTLNPYTIFISSLPFYLMFCYLLFLNKNV